MLAANQNKINWENLAKNPAAGKLLAANPDKVKWSWMRYNPAKIDLFETNLPQCICHHVNKLLTTYDPTDPTIDEYLMALIKQHITV